MTTLPNDRSIKSAIAAVEEDYCIPMAIFDSRTLTRTTWRESLKWDAGQSYFKAYAFRHLDTHLFAGTAQ